MTQENQALARREPAPIVSAESLAKVLGKGDIASLNDRQKVEFLEAVSNAAGLNPLLRPFEFINFPKGGMKLYFTVEGADQIIGKHRLSVDYSDVHEDKDRQLVMQWATVSDRERSVKAVGIISIAARVNKDGRNTQMDYEDILMKLESKCRRRAVKAFGGLSLIDDLTQSEEETATTVVNIRPAEAPALSSGDDEPLPFDPEPKLGACDWSEHNTPFTNRSNTGVPIHRWGDGWCNGQKILGVGGVIIAERKPEAPEPDLMPEDYPFQPGDKGSEAYQAAYPPKAGDGSGPAEPAAESSSADPALDRLQTILALADVGAVNLWLDRVEGAGETDALHGRAKALGLTWDAEIGEYADADGLPF